MKYSKIIKLYLLLVSLAINGCHADDGAPADKKQHVVKVEMRRLTKSLFFMGTIKPLKIINVVSPVEGVIKEKLFQYGQQIKQGDQLLTLSSSKLAEDYQSALVQYLKAKNAYYSAREKFIGTQDLMKHELISKDLFDAEQRQLASNNLDYLQSQYKLQEILKKGKPLDEQLSLDNIDAAAKALRKPFKQQEIIAPSTGISLAPTKSEGGGEQSTGQSGSIEVGSQVKSGQVLLAIGDLTGIALNIQIPEIDIDKVKHGLSVTVTGAAFPGIILQGKITNVAAQAKSASSGSSGLPTFNVEVVVPTLTPVQRQHIYVGMSAKVDLQLSEPPAMTIPINAVYEKKNNSYVKVFNSKTKKTSERLVTTGKTTAADVIITSGLQTGEQVMLHD